MGEEQSLAVELIKDSNKVMRKILVFCGSIIILLICGLVGLNVYYTQKIETQNQYWIDFMSQYDFESYTQDGEGVNNINTGTQGDVINEPNP